MELITNGDQFIAQAAQAGGMYVYIVLFLVYFFETGIVLCAIFPGDSLIFVCGAAAAAGVINPYAAFFAIALGAIFGNNLAYIQGVWFGKRLFNGSIRWINAKYIKMTQEFFKKHGGKTILFARFFPFIRSCAPLVAGAARMNLWKFNISGILGAILWAGIVLWVGYLFGNIPIIKNNLSLILLTGVLCGVGPIVIGLIIQGRKEAIKAKARYEEKKLEMERRKEIASGDDDPARSPDLN